MVKQSKVMTLVKYMVVAVAIFFLSILIFKTIGNLTSLELFVLAASTFFIGYLVADLLTGTIHWFCDTFFSEKTPVIGSFVIFSFREHHTHPHLITEDKFIEQDTTSFFVLLIPLISAVYSDSIYPQNLGAYLFHSGLAGLSIGAFSTNLFHKWAHMDNPPELIKKFQNMGLILNRERHKIHHANHSRSFCVTSGLMNPLLDKIKFFQLLEYFIRLFSYESRT
tara:strand:+ start:88 stop:756 length:669 start_codon:yes stop_codon:yes gene_type:complete